MLTDSKTKTKLLYHEKFGCCHIPPPSQNTANFWLNSIKCSNFLGLNLNEDKISRISQLALSFSLSQNSTIGWKLLTQRTQSRALESSQENPPLIWQNVIRSLTGSLF